ncbi:MAG: AAA family ATPase [Chloroflexota bacterium]|nr:AAA family ATPase [Chloroflexota bacterium]
MLDLIVVGGAPGSGKTTICRLIQAETQWPLIEFGYLRQFHLDRAWTNISPREEQMSFENLTFIVRNYVHYGYKHVILNDLEDFRVQQIPDLFSDIDYIIFDLIVESDDELKRRVLDPTRDSGFRDHGASLAWNDELKRRSLRTNEHRIDNSDCDPAQTMKIILRAIEEHEC